MKTAEQLYTYERTAGADIARAADLGAITGARWSSDPPRLSLPIDRRPMSSRLRAVLVLLIVCTVLAVVGTAIGGTP